MFRNKVSEIVYVFQKIVSGLYYWMFRNKVSELVKVFRLIVPETEIMKLRSLNCIVNSISSDKFPTKAKRPKFSVLDKAKIKNTFNIEVPYWRDSLMECLKNK